MSPERLAVALLLEHDGAHVQALPTYLDVRIEAGASAAGLGIK